MTESDRDAFAELLTQALGFYGQAVSPFALGVWWQACQGCELQQLRRSLTAHAMDPERGQFAPKPADIVRQLRGTYTDRSLIAWGKVLGAMQRVGAYASVAFDDPAIHAAVTDLGGWPAVCRSSTDELPFLQRRFTDSHRAHSLRPDGSWPRVLAGDSDRTNAALGYAEQKPVLIGDKAAALAVSRGESPAGGPKRIGVAA